MIFRVDCLDSRANGNTLLAKSVKIYPIVRRSVDNDGKRKEEEPEYS
jgi:hypothetical protein